MRIAATLLVAGTLLARPTPEHLTVGARLGPLDAPAALAEASPQLAAAEGLALAALADCDDVVRMVLPASALGPMRTRDHLELGFGAARQVRLAALRLDLPVARLFLPLDFVGTDWLMYVERPAGRGLLETYRWRAPKPVALQALREAVSAYLWSLRRHATTSRSSRELLPCLPLGA
jgi:hypothetical protein